MAELFDELNHFNHEKEKINEFESDENYKSYDKHCTNIVNSYFQTQAYTVNQEEINIGDNLDEFNNNDNNGQNPFYHYE